MSKAPTSGGPQQYAEASAKGHALSDAAIRAHLLEVLASPPFETSKRSRDLLTHVVEETLVGRGDHIKERSIGEDVFGRPGYEPSEQNVVRVAANELRKRLAQFYELHPDTEIHIELPRGSYIPVFRTRQYQTEAVSSVEAPAKRTTWRKSVGLALALCAVAAIAVWTWMRPGSPEEAFWQSVLSSKTTPLIWATGWGAVMTPEMRSELVRHEGATSPYTVEVNPNSLIVVDQMIGFGHVSGVAAITSWLGRHQRQAELRLGNWQAPTAVRDRPLILFGSLNNPWTVDLTRDLRFSVQQTADGPRIVDRAQPGRHWTLPHWDESRGYMVSADFGLVTKVTDHTTGQVRIAIGGLCHYASQAGAEFITSPKFWTDVDHVAPKGWQQMNMQVVLSMRVVEKAPEDIKAIAWHFW